MNKNKPFFLLLFLLVLIGCDKKTNKDDFKLINRGSYSTRFINDVQVLIKDNKLMDGYYVVGNTFNKWEEFEVSKGVLNGVNIIYHPNGNKSSITKYNRGKKYGEEQHYYPSGKLQKTVTYKNDKRVGTIKAYYESGQIQEESTVKNEEVIESVTYNNVGNIISQMFIKDGIKIRQTLLDGKLFSENLSSTYDSYEAIKMYNQDGSLRHHLNIVEDNKDLLIRVLDKDGNEIKNIDLKKDPEGAKEYLSILERFY